MKIKILLLFVSLVFMASGSLPGDAHDLISVILKGGRPFSLEEIDDVRERTDIEDHHKAILLIQMLSSVDDARRYEEAISLAENYIEHGTIPWSRDFLEMQRGFLLGLKGDRKQGAMVLENKLENNRFDELGKIDDYLIREMTRKHGDLGMFFNDLICSSLGFYYLDFAGDDKNPEKSYVFFSLIRMEGLKKKNLKQISLREGVRIDEFDMKEIDRQIKQYASRFRLNERRARGPDARDTERPHIDGEARSAERGKENLAEPGNRKSSGMPSRWILTASLAVLLAAIGVWFKSRTPSR